MLDEKQLAQRRDNLRRGRETAAANRVTAADRVAAIASRVSAERSARLRTADDATAEAQARTEQPAQRRNEPIREQLAPNASPEVFTRLRREQRQVGGFDIPDHYKKSGWDYQYITIRVLREPVDPGDLRAYREGGWRPVLARDMPKLADDGAAPDSPIEVQGQRLYTRPMHLTMEARQEDADYAKAQQYERTMQAAAGKATGRNHPGMSLGRGMRVEQLGLEIVGEAG